MIGEMCTKPVVTISPKVSVQEAARLMRRKNVGALVMVDSAGSGPDDDHGRRSDASRSHRDP
jgi:CBS domain-containing protein